MREIKFRAKAIYDGKWVYGHYFVNAHYQEPCANIWAHDENDTLWVVLGDTVGQYTGIKDVNNKEIYEGDIVCDPWGDKHIVLWKEVSGMFTYGDNINEYLPTFLWCRSYECDELDKPKVIGNIYDNPELLEVDK